MIAPSHSTAKYTFPKCFKIAIIDFAIVIMVAMMATAMMVTMMMVMMVMIIIIFVVERRRRKKADGSGLEIFVFLFK